MAKQSAFRLWLTTDLTRSPHGRTLDITSFAPAPREASRAPIDPARTFTTIAKIIRDEGLLERARWFYALLATGIFFAFAAIAWGMYTLGDNWLQLVLAVVLGIVLTQAAFMAHESAHRQVLSGGPANDRIGRFLGVFVAGMSYQWWMNKHTRHHANPNTIDKDPDIASDVIVFTPEAAAARRGSAALFSRNQGWLFYPLLTLEGFNLHIHSFKSLFERREVEGRWIELTMLVVRFTLLFGFILWVMPFWMGVAFFIVQTMAYGFYMGSSFAVNHIGMPIIPADARYDFFRKQVLTSRNVRGGFFASALLGGLNYQVEHHLFPNMARPHLARTRRIIREYCRTNDIAYTEMSLARAHVHVARHVHTVGLAAKDPFTCPFVSRYRRG